MLSIKTRTSFFFRFQEVKKNIKQYSEKYKRLDDVYHQNVSKEQLEKRKKMMDEFVAFRRNAARRAVELRQKRLELRGGIDTEELANNREEIEYTVQFLVETKKEEIND